MQAAHPVSGAKVLATVQKDHAFQANLKNKSPVGCVPRGGASPVFSAARYLLLKSNCHQPSSHSSVTLRQPRGTCG
ncbi:MAG: hypothetical protein KatS3mg110_4094 [Pirellulaceae bacterium]|nr:MAG: hypothetical protein KatS3mg110_4094 [Pirellulaceae bacterium]